MAYRHQCRAQAIAARRRLPGHQTPGARHRYLSRNSRFRRLLSPFRLRLRTGETLSPQSRRAHRTRVRAALPTHAGRNALKRILRALDLRDGLGRKACGGTSIKEVPDMGASSWRELLGRIIADPQEKQRVVNELGINPITLIRWVKGEVVPRDENLRRLLEVLPAQREALAQLLMEAFPTLVVPSGQDIPEYATRVPAEFYSRVLNIYVTTPPERRFWSVSDLTIQLALGQLDPNYLGMAFVIAQCMPPAGATHKIRS